MPVRSMTGPLFNIIGNAWEMVDGRVTPSAPAVALFATVQDPRATAQHPWNELGAAPLQLALGPT